MIYQNEDKKSEELMKFYKNIIIPFSDQRDFFPDLKLETKQIKELNIKNNLDIFKNKIEMMVIEFEAFQELFEDLKTFKKYFLKKLKTKNDLETKLKNEINKDKITDLEKNVKTAENNLQDLEKICEILQMILREREIPKIIKNKKLEYKHFLNILAKNKLKVIRSKIEFWNSIKDVSGTVVGQNS